jgi:hypothetical protein
VPGELVSRDTEKRGGGFWLALERVYSGMVSQGQCGGALRRIVQDSSKLRVSHFSIEQEAYFLSFGVSQGMNRFAVIMRAVYETVIRN